MIVTFYTDRFRSIINELCREQFDDYTVIEHHLITKVVDEVKRNLILMSNEDMRFRYIKTFLYDITYQPFEHWFGEISKVLEFKHDRIYYIAHDGKTLPKLDLRSKAIVKFIKWRTELIYELSVSIASIYPGFEFSEVVKDCNITHNQLVWIESQAFKKLDPNYFIAPALIAKLYEFCVSENLFAGSYKVNDFIECFNLNASIRQHPPFNHLKQKYFTYILTSIDDNINKQQAKECFGIKSFATEKTRWKQDAKEREFKSKVKAMLKLYHPNYS